MLVAVLFLGDEDAPVEGRNALASAAIVAPIRDIVTFNVVLGNIGHF